MSDMLEQKVEAQIIAALTAALAAAGAAAVPVIGFLTPAAAGVVKTEDLTAVGVKVAPRFNSVPGSPCTRLNCEVTACVAASESKDGVLALAVFSAVMSVLEAWHFSPVSAAAALDIAAQWATDGFLFTEGGMEDFDTARSVWILIIPFQLAGRVSAPVTTTTTTTTTAG